MPIDPKVLDAMVEAGMRAYAKTIGFKVDSLPAKDWEGIRACIFAALRAAEALPVPHKLVGRDATDEMAVAAHHALYHWREKQGDPQQNPDNPTKHKIRFAAWRDWLRRLPGLHVWGYTAHAPFSGTGTGVRELNEDYPDRCAIRFSGPTATPGDYMRATTIWKQPEGAWVKEGLVCPVSTNKAQACGSCGLCWSPEMRDTPIVFIGHGMNTRSGK